MNTATHHTTEQPAFLESFGDGGNYCCTGDTISTTIDGFDITARIEFDPDYHIDDNDCHNPDQSVTGCDDEQQKRLLAARQAWFDNGWFYCRIVLSVSKNGVTLDDYVASLWGIECNYPDFDNSYLTEVANELLHEALDRARAILEHLRA